jgi:PAS domain S-box-containing protein
VSSVQLEHAFRRTYLWVSLITAIIAIVSHSVLISATNTYIETAHQGDLAADVRETFHEVEFLISRLIIVSDADERQAIRHEIDTSLGVLSALYTEVQAEPQSSALLAIHFQAPYQLAQHMTDFLNTAHQLTMLDIVTAETPAYQQLIAQHPHVQHSLKVLTDKYQEQRTAYATQTQRVDFALLLLILVSVGANIVLNFRPMERLIVNTQNALKAEVERSQAAASALRENEMRFRTLFEQTNDAIFIMDLNGKLLAVNQSAIDMVGFAREDINTYPIPQLSAESVPSLNILERLVAGERLPIYERLFRRKDGTTFPVEINAEVVRSSDGKPLHIQSIVRDISQRKQAEQALKESEKLYRTLVQNMPGTAVIMFDAEMRYTLVDGPFLKRAGIIGHELVGKQPADVFDAEMLKIILPINQRILQGEAFSYEFSRPNFAYHAYATPLRDDDGKITGGLILEHDTTDVMHTEQALRESEQRLRLITDSIQDLITQTDGNDRITFASPSYQTVLGYDPASLIGKSGKAFLHPDDLDRFRTMLAEISHTPSEPFFLEGRLIASDGRVIWMETVGKLLTDADGKLSGGVYVSRDVNARKRLDQALIEQQKLRIALEKEQELSTLKSRMMEVISHEFRTPLAVIQVSMGTLADYFDRITAEQRASKFDTIYDRIRRITNMLDELDIIVRGSFTPDMVHRVPLDLAAMCRKISTDLEAEYKLTGKCALQLTEPALIYADPFVLTYAIKPILSNAIRFSAPAAAVNVTLVAQDGGFTLTVIDTGLGIPAEEQKQLFQPFFRGSNIGTIGGLGLGLTIAQAAVTAHSGRITIESVENQGTTVSLWIPIKT